MATKFHGIGQLFGKNGPSNSKERTKNGKFAKASRHLNRRHRRVYVQPVSEEDAGESGWGSPRDLKGDFSRLKSEFSIQDQSAPSRARKRGSKVRCLASGNMRLLGKTCRKHPPPQENRLRVARILTIFRYADEGKKPVIKDTNNWILSVWHSLT